MDKNYRSRTTRKQQGVLNVRMVLSRKQSHHLFALAFVAGVVGICLSANVARAQAPNPAGANASRYGVGVVDISYIFKKHERFRAAMESMKKEMETIEVQLKADREKIAQSEQQRNTFNAGTAEHKRLDEEVARMMADFNLKMGRMRKDFLEREAKVYYQTYLEVVESVNAYAKRQNIGLVLRFNGEPVDPNRRDDVLREINKPVVVQDQIDITPDVLMILNRDAQAARPAQPGSQLPPR
jgi:Skp family chaperone for outer membrane proteins